MRLRLIASVFAAGALLAVPAVAQAADVTVNFARDGGSKTVSLGSLAGSFDVNQEYSLISASGQTTSTQIHGISLRALLDAVGADPTYSAVTIARPGGGSVRISRSQIEAPDLTPVVYSDGGQSTFVRPAYSASDRNAQDVISASPLVITQVDGTDYGLTAKVSKSSAKAGEALRFTASATGAAGQKLIYTWNFNDGSTASGARATHRFKRRGYYRVLVSVRGEGETASVSSVVTVQVGKADKSEKRREGGGTNNDAGAPVSGQADGAGGAGAEAGSGASKRAKTAKKKRRAVPRPASDLQEVTGELLSAPEQVQPQNDLAARTGQKVERQKSSPGIPTEAAGAAIALGLLSLGVALELGAASRLRRRLLA